MICFVPKNGFEGYRVVKCSVSECEEERERAKLTTTGSTGRFGVVVEEVVLAPGVNELALGRKTNAGALGLIFEVSFVVVVAGVGLGEVTGVVTVETEAEAATSACLALALAGLKGGISAIKVDVEGLTTRLTVGTTMGAEVVGTAEVVEVVATRGRMTRCGDVAGLAEVEPVGVGRSPMILARSLGVPVLSCLVAREKGKKSASLAR